MDDYDIEDYDLDDIDDSDTNEDLMYEVWILGYDEDDNVTEDNTLVETFSERKAAINFADDLLDQIIDREIDVRDDYEISLVTKYVEIRVESVIEVDGYTENVDTIFSKHSII